MTFSLGICNFILESIGKVLKFRLLKNTIERLSLIKIMQIKLLIISGNVAKIRRRKLHW